MTIFLYNSQGADPKHLAATERELKRYLKGSESHVIPVDKSYLDRDLQKMGTVVVFPGGNALHMQSALGETIEKVRQFVNGGNGYLGICAGGYLGASQVDYTSGETILPIKFNLGFVNRAVGPAFADWDQRKKPHWKKQISAGEDSFEVTWRGGGAFCDGEVVARYEDLPDKPAAIVQQGSAVLCGPHPEMGSESEQALFDRLCKLVGI